MSSAVVMKLSFTKTARKRARRSEKVQCNEIMKKYGHRSKKRVFCWIQFSNILSFHISFFPSRRIALLCFAPFLKRAWKMIFSALSTFAATCERNILNHNSEHLWDVFKKAVLMSKCDINTQERGFCFLLIVVRFGCSRSAYISSW